MIKDTNGCLYSQKIRREPRGNYSKIVFFGPKDFASTVRRNYYRTYKEAQQANICDTNIIGSETLI